LILLRPPHSVSVQVLATLDLLHSSTSTDLSGYMHYPHANQVCAIRRATTCLVSNEFTTETVYGITSLEPIRANPTRLLDSSRKHWCIENRLPYVRDVTFDEDRSRVRRGAGAQVMPSIRNLALSILRIAAPRYIPSALRCCSRQGDPFVFRLIGVRL